MDFTANRVPILSFGASKFQGSIIGFPILSTMSCSSSVANGEQSE